MSETIPEKNTIKRQEKSSKTALYVVLASHGGEVKATSDPFSPGATLASERSHIFPTSPPHLLFVLRSIAASFPLTPHQMQILYSMNSLWNILWAMSIQSCPTLCNPMDCSPPGSSIHGVLQARILEWVTMFSSRGSSQPRDPTCFSYVSCTGRQVLYH